MYFSSGTVCSRSVIFVRASRRSRPYDIESETRLNSLPTGVGISFPIMAMQAGIGCPALRERTIIRRVSGSWRVSFAIRNLRMRLRMMNGRPTPSTRPPTRLNTGNHTSSSTTARTAIAIMPSKTRSVRTVRPHVCTRLSKLRIGAVSKISRSHGETPSASVGRRSRNSFAKLRDSSRMSAAKNRQPWISAKDATTKTT